MTAPDHRAAIRRLAGRKRGGRNITVSAMRAMGYERRPAAPKVRFVHRAKGRAT